MSEQVSIAFDCRLVSATFELECVERTIENEIALGLSQRDIAQTYALGLKSSRRREIDWARVNAAILKRWPKGLSRVKQMAYSGKCFKETK